MFGFWFLKTNDAYIDIVKICRHSFSYRLQIFLQKHSKKFSDNIIQAI